MADQNIILGVLFQGQADLPSFEKAIGQVKRKIDALEKSVNRLNSNTKLTADRAAAAINKLGGSMGTMGAQTTRVGNDLRRSGDELNKWERKARQAGAGAGFFSTMVGGVNRALRTVTQYGIAAVTIYNIGRAFRVGVTEIIDFSQALKNVQAITGATDREITALDAKIRTVARTTKFSTVEVAEGVVLLGQAGFTASESLDAIQAVSDLATGTLTSLELSADLLTSTIRAFNLQASEAGRVSDVMANAINRSKLTIDKLRISFNFVGAIAHQAGLSLEETAAAMMNLANSGIRASTIGTGLRQVLSRLIAPNKKLREAFEEYNISLEKINPSIVGFQDSIGELSKVLWDSEKRTVDMGKAFTLFGLRGAQAAAIIVSSFVRGDYQKALKNAYETGSAAEMAAKQAEGLGLKFKNLADRAKLVALALGDAGVSGILHGFVDTLRAVSEGLETLISSLGGRLLIATAGWTAALLGAGKAIQLLITSIRALTAQVGIYVFFSQGAGGLTALGTAAAYARAAISGLWAVMAAHPILTIAGAAGALIAIFNEFTNQTQKTIDALDQEIIKINGLTSSLSGYTGNLETLIDRKKKGQKVAVQYQGTIARLIKAHPELAQKIDGTNYSLEGMAAALEEVRNLMGNLVLKSMTKAIQKIQLLTERIKNLREEAELADQWGPGLYNQAKQAEEANKKAGRAVRDRADAIAILTQQMLEQIITGQTTLDQVLASITRMEMQEQITKELADTLRNNLKAAYDSLNESIKANTESLEKNAGAIDPEAVAKRLVKIANAVLNAEARTSEARLAYIRKWMDEVEVSAKDRKKIEEALSILIKKEEEKRLKEVKKKEKKKRELYEETLKLREDLYKKDEEFQKNLVDTYIESLEDILDNESLNVFERKEIQQELFDWKVHLLDEELQKEKYAMLTSEQLERLRAAKIKKIRGEVFEDTKKESKSLWDDIKKSLDELTDFGKVFKTITEESLKDIQKGFKEFWETVVKDGEISWQKLWGAFLNIAINALAQVSTAMALSLFRSGGSSLLSMFGTGAAGGGGGSPGGTGFLSKLSSLFGEGSGSGGFGGLLTSWFGSSTAPTTGTFAGIPLGGGSKTLFGMGASSWNKMLGNAGIGGAAGGIAASLLGPSLFKGYNQTASGIGSGLGSLAGAGLAAAGLIPGPGWAIAGIGALLGGLGGGGLFADDDAEVEKKRMETAKKLAERFRKIQEGKEKVTPGDWLDLMVEVNRGTDARMLQREPLEQLAAQMRLQGKLPWWGTGPGPIGHMFPDQKPSSPRQLQEGLIAGAGRSEYGYLGLEKLLGTDKWERVKAAVSELSDESLDNLGSSLTAVKDISATFGVELEDLFADLDVTNMSSEELAQTIRDRLNPAMLIEQQRVKDLENGVSKLDATKKALNSTVTTLLSNQNIEEEQYKQLIDQAMRYGSSLKDLEAKTEEYNDIYTILMNNQSLSEEQTKRVIELLDLEGAAADRLRKSQSLTAEEMDKLVQKGQSLHEELGLGEGAIDKLNSTLAGEDGLISAVQDLKKALEDLPEKISTEVETKFTYTGDRPPHFHKGGWVGRSGKITDWSDAIIAHTGKWMGKLKEIPAILQEGERVLSNKEISNMGGPAQVDMAAAGRFRPAPVEAAPSEGDTIINLNISAWDAESVRSLDWRTIFNQELIPALRDSIKTGRLPLQTTGKLAWR